MNQFPFPISASDISREMGRRECPYRTQEHLRDVDAMSADERRRYLQARRSATEAVGDWVRHQFGESDATATARMLNDYRAERMLICQAR